MNPKDLPSNTPVEALNDVAHKDLDYSRVPYAKPQPMGMIADLVIPGALDVLKNPAGDDPRLWIPLSNTVSLRPVHFNVSQGFYAHVMRVPRVACCRAIAMVAACMRWCSRAAGTTWSTIG